MNIQKVHNLVTFEEQLGNLPPYKWHVLCSCGFEARVGTKFAAQDQYNSHLIANNVKPHVFDDSVVVVPEVKTETKTEIKLVDSKAKTTAFPWPDANKGK